MVAGNFGNRIIYGGFRSALVVKEKKFYGSLSVGVSALCQ